MADQVLQEIKDKLDIVEVISGYIPLKKSGLNFKAPCPFHNEKTPSLMVSPQKQIWHCFGCGEGGDVFGFVMRIENIEFREALKMLADRAGVELPQYKPQDPAVQDERDRLLRINKFAAAFYHKFLEGQKQAEPARNYLKTRGLSSATIKQWQIGFAPEEFHALETALNQKKVLPAHAITAGVLGKNDRGQIYDRFRNRITFPIFNYYGDVVGFSARAMPGSDKDSAKYINSPETPIYNKSKILFGLNFAKEAIRRANAVVIVEGQMDTISAHQAGFANTVASSGTALTEDHLNLIGRLTKNLIFCFDADSAGQAATRRAGELALMKGFAVRIVVLSGGKDPDELIRTNKTEWEQQLKDAIWFVDYYLDLAGKNFSYDSVEQKKYIGDQVVPLLSRLSDPIELDHYVKKIAEKFNIGDSVLRNLIKPASVAAAPAKPAQALRTNSNSIQEKQVLGGMLMDPEFAQLVRDQGSIEDFSHGETQVLALALLKSADLSQDLVSGTLAKEAEFMVESELELLDGNHHALTRELQKSFYSLKVAAIKRRQQAISAEIKQAELSKNKQQVEALQQEFAALNEQRMDFERRLA